MRRADRRLGRLRAPVEPGHDRLVAVRTNHESDEDPAIDLIQNTAAAALNGLRDQRTG